MVDEINPNYYADGELNTGFNLVGNNFNDIPANAIGLFARHLDNKLEFRYTINESLLYRIADKTNETMRLESYEPTTQHARNFLGAIVSKDRNIVFWINDLVS